MIHIEESPGNQGGIVSWGLLNRSDDAAAKFLCKPAGNIAKNSTPDRLLVIHIEPEAPPLRQHLRQSAIPGAFTKPFGSDPVGCAMPPGTNSVNRPFSQGGQFTRVSSGRSRPRIDASARGLIWLSVEVVGGF